MQTSKGWRETKLGAVAGLDRVVVHPAAISHESVYVGLEHVDPDGTIAYQTVAAGELRSAKFAFSGRHVLYGKLRPYLRKVGRPNTAGICSTDILPILVGPDLDRDYLFHWLRQPRIVSLASARSDGVNLPRVSPKTLLGLPFSLPPLEEQRRIATLLDKAVAVRRNQQESIRLLNELLQSAFLEMFGDLVRNDKGWDVALLGELCEVQLGKMLSAKAHGGADPIPYLRNANVQWRRIDLSSVFEMDFSNTELAKFDLRPGDLLVCEGGEVGRCAIWEGQLAKCSFQKALHRVRPRDSRIRIEYLQELLYSLAHAGALAKSTSKATIAHLTKVQLQQLRLPLPSEDLQDRFVRIYRSILQARKRQELRLNHMNRLFESLSHQAFQMQR